MTETMGAIRVSDERGRLHRRMLVRILRMTGAGRLPPALAIVLASSMPSYVTA